MEPSGPELSLVYAYKHVTVVLQPAGLARMATFVHTFVSHVRRRPKRSLRDAQNMDMVMVRGAELASECAARRKQPQSHG